MAAVGSFAACGLGLGDAALGDAAGRARDAAVVWRSRRDRDPAEPPDARTAPQASG